MFVESARFDGIGEERLLRIDYKNIALERTVDDATSEGAPRYDH